MPTRFGNLIRALDHFAVTVEPARGSHWKATKAGFGCYIIPAHKGTKQELDDVYLRGVCRNSASTSTNCASTSREPRILRSVAGLTSKMLGCLIPPRRRFALEL